MSQSNHLVWIWMPDSFMSHREREAVRTQVKRQNTEGESVRQVLQNISGKGQPLEGIC